MESVRHTILAAGLLGAIGTAAYLLLRSQKQHNCGHKTASRPPADKGRDSTGATVAILTAPDGVELYVRHWEPLPAAAAAAAADGTPNAATAGSDGGVSGSLEELEDAEQIRRQPCSAVLLMVHGFNWHSAYFSAAAKQLSEAMAVVALDLPGYGLSGSATGVRGFHPGGLAGYAACVQVVVDFIRQLHPDAPIFLLGESMGGAVVLYALQQPQIAAEIRGAICMAATSELPTHLMPSDLAVKIYCGLASLAPGLAVPASGFTKQQDFMSSFGDVAVGRAAWADPLVVKKFPMGQMAALLPQVKQMSTGPLQVNQSILVIHGENDVRVIPETSQRLLARLTAQDKTLMLVQGGRHLLFLDEPSIVQAVLADIKAWLQARL